MPTIKPGFVDTPMTAGFRKGLFWARPAMIATTIYAMPPMVRVTMMGLRQVPVEVVEAGRMAGCMRRQLLWKVQIPSAKRSLMIGAGGLGFDVLTALKRLKIGEGVEAGVAITLLAIALDRLSQTYAHRPPPQRGEARKSFVRRNPYLVAAVAVMAATWLVGAVLPAVQTYPEALEITTGSFWGDVVKYINLTFFDQLDGMKNFLLLNLMIPFKRFLLSLPWVAVVGLVALAGLQLGGSGGWPR